MPAQIPAVAADVLNERDADAARALLAEATMTRAGRGKAPLCAAELAGLTGRA